MYAWCWLRGEPNCDCVFAMNFDVNKIRADFPILETKINDNPLVYFDNGASAQKPQCVIDAVNRAYGAEYANVHRGLHHLSNLATEKYEGTRAIVAKFLNAPEKNIIFTTGSTEAINLISYGWGMANLSKGDEIILSVMEHHANIVPWHFLRERLGIVLKWIDIDDDGSLPAKRVIDAIGQKTKLIAISQMSNVTGVRVDVAAIAKNAKEKGVRVLVDGSQAAVHGPVDMRDIGADFYCITGHKLYGPTGSGALYVSEVAMSEMRPFMGGGDMIDRVTRDEITYASGPMRFEAGTPGIVETIGFGVALNYLMDIGMDQIAAYEASLRDYAIAKISALDFIEVQGTTADKGAIFSFTMKGAHAHDISTIVDQKGVALRAGTHCAQVLMDRLGVTSTCRASMAMYNTTDEIDRFVDALHLANKLLG